MPHRRCQFCARHKIGANVKEVPMENVNDALAELHNKQVPFRFVLTNK